MGQELDTNEENNRLRVFEKKKHQKDEDKLHDADGHRNPKSTGEVHRDQDIANDGGGVGRNNGADKSGR